jgi:FkbM family methyltransferase
MIKRLEHFGTAYGGWWIAPDLLPSEGVCIDAGVGTDTSFCERLRDKCPGILFIGVDHTQESLDYATKRGCYDKFINAAVTGGETLYVEMFKNAKGGSESVLRDHNFVCDEAYRVPAVRLAQLVSFHNPCVVKLDIEGAEYECYKDCFGVQQVCLEFHHRMLSRYTEQDTDRVLADFGAHGYELAHRTERDEVLLVMK